MPCPHLAQGYARGITAGNKVHNAKDAYVSPALRRGERNAMFHRRHKDTPGPPIVSSRVRTVRLLQDPEELQEAVERARGFERRGANEYQRRIGSYDRFLNHGEDHPANVVSIDSSAEAS